jgi:hypothetical protein
MIGEGEVDQTAFRRWHRFQFYLPALTQSSLGEFFGPSYDSSFLLANPPVYVQEEGAPLPQTSEIQSQDMGKRLPKLGVVLGNGPEVSTEVNVEAVLFRKEFHLTVFS